MTSSVCPNCSPRPSREPVTHNAAQRYSTCTRSDLPQNAYAIDLTIIVEAITRHSRNFFSILLLCSLSRVQTQFFVSAASEGRLIGAHSRRQDPKTPVEQALMRGLATA